MWGMFKNKVYSDNPHTEDDLKKTFRIKLFQFHVQWYICLLHTTHAWKLMETTYTKLYILYTVLCMKLSINPTSHALAPRACQNMQEVY